MLLMHCFRTCRDNLAADDEFTIKYDIPVSVVKRKSETSLHPVQSLSNNVSTTTSSRSPKIKILRSIEDEDLSKIKKSKSEVPTPVDVVIWENSSASNTYNCRGWMRSEDEWGRGNKKVKKIDPILLRCAQDDKFRTRLCNH